MKKREGCPVEAFMNLISGQWSTYILWQLELNGALRFGKLKKSIPSISSKVLTDKLRALQGAGLVYRDYKPTVPPEVTYGLTERGQELRKTLKEMTRLAESWRAEGII
jgi:DNA-binding HxlR family transcriptional regulator